MEIDEIKTLLINALHPKEVYVTGGGNHFQITVVSNEFIGMSRVKQQKIIYAPLMKYVLDNHIHALSIQTYTPDAWERHQKLKNF